MRNVNYTKLKSKVWGLVWFFDSLQLTFQAVSSLKRENYFAITQKLQKKITKTFRSHFILASSSKIFPKNQYSIRTRFSLKPNSCSSLYYFLILFHQFPFRPLRIDTTQQHIQMPCAHYKTFVMS